MRASAILPPFYSDQGPSPRAKPGIRVTPMFTYANSSALHKKPDANISRAEFIQELLKTANTVIYCRLLQTMSVWFPTLAGKGEDSSCDFSCTNISRQYRNKLVKNLRIVVDDLNSLINDEKLKLGIFWVDSSQRDKISVRFNASDDEAKIGRFQKLAYALIQSHAASKHNLDELIKALILVDFGNRIESNENASYEYDKDTKKLRIYTGLHRTAGQPVYRLVDEYNSSFNVDLRLGVFDIQRDKDLPGVYEIEFNPTEANRTYQDYKIKVIERIDELLDFVDDYNISLDSDAIKQCTESAFRVGSVHCSS